MWLLRLRRLLNREPRPRDGRGGAADRARSGAAKSGSTKSGSTKSGAVATVAPSLSPWWVVGLGGVVLILHVVLFPPVPRVATHFPGLGEIAEHQIRAPFGFEAPLLEAEVQVRRLERVLVEPPFLRVLSDGAGHEGGARMDLWLTAVAASLADSGSTVARAEYLAVQFPVVAAEELHRLLSAAEPDSLVPRLREAWRSMLRGGVVDMLPPGRYDRVVVASPRSEDLRDVSRVVAQANLEARLTAELRTAGLPPVEAVEAAAIMRRFVAPNLVYDPHETQLRREAARDAIPTRREFISGERIVDQGVRVTEQQALFLEQLETLLVAQGVRNDTRIWTRYAARILLLSALFGLFAWLARAHVPVRLRGLRVLMAQTVLLGVFLGGAAVALGQPSLGPMAVPIVLLSLMATVLFKARVGYTMTLLAVGLLMVLPDVTAWNVFVWFCVGMTTVISVRRIQKRSQFYQTIVLLTALSVFMILLRQLAGVDPDLRGGDYLVGFFTPVLSVAFGLFLLPVVEPLVGVCS
ncbi:hypothetical protein DRQ50_12430, partial [bacterium]